MVDEQTTRQKIRGFLEKSINGASPSRIEDYFDRVYDEELTTGEILSHIDHLRQSQEHADWQMFARPPECKDCHFDEFHELVNIPSRCPKCRSEWIQEPAFDIVREEESG